MLMFRSLRTLDAEETIYERFSEASITTSSRKTLIEFQSHFNIIKVNRN